MKITNLNQQPLSTHLINAFASDVLNGLTSQPKSLPSKYFYDDVGSELFQRISQHEDYYLTRTEFAILAAASEQMPQIIQDEVIDIIELGAGDGHKTKLIIDGFLEKGHRVNFYPIDISEKAMSLLGENLSVSEHLTIHGIVSDYLSGIAYLKNISNNKKLVLFLGSNIGNFNQAESERFLKNLWFALDASDHLLVGFDLKKAPEVLNKAYNDRAGLTQAFNLNLLSRINRELGANFDPTKYQHYGFYNPRLGAMESYLIATEAQAVYFSAIKKTIQFEKCEAVHVESSYKYTTEDIHALAKRIGFHVEADFTDKNHFFLNALWQVNKQ